MLWMASEVSGHRLVKDFFVDVGANIGSCTMHMASLGLPVISIEPVQQHVSSLVICMISLDVTTRILSSNLRIGGYDPRNN